MSVRSILWSGWYCPAAFLVAGVYLLALRRPGGGRKNGQFPPAAIVGIGWLYVLAGVAGIIAAAVVH